MPTTSASTQPQYGELTNAQEQQATALAVQLSDCSYKVRQAAQAKLVDMGSPVVPLLQRLVEGSDAEAALRIQDILRRYRYLSSGVLVTWVDPAGTAAKAGILAGDVIVKIDDIEVASAVAVNPQYMYSPTALIYNQVPRVYQLRRQGQSLTVQAPAGQFGINIADWDNAVGSKAKLLAFGAFYAGVLNQAYPLLKQVQGELNRDELYALAGVAENALDHQFAIGVYRQAADGQDEPYPFKAVPAINVRGPICSQVRAQVTSLHTAWLMEKWRKNQVPAGDFAQWLLGPGHNLPLARKVAATKTPRPENTGESNQQWHNLVLARMKIAMYDRDWNTVISNLSDHLCPATANVALRAAIEKMDYDKVCELGLYLAKDCQASAASADNAGCILALAALWLADRNDLADKLVAELKKLEPAILEKLAASPEADATEIPALDAKTLPLLEQLASSQPTPEFIKRMHRRWARFPDLTSTKWSALNAKYAPQPGRGGVMQMGFYDQRLQTVDPTLIWCRLGQYDNQALQQLSPVVVTNNYYPANMYGLPDAPRNALAIRWLKERENAKRLTGDWAQLSGTMTVSAGLEKDSHWAVRWDGQVFYVDPEGKITKYDGIEPNTFNDFIRTGSVMAFPSGTIYVCDSQVYLLDDKLKRWAPTFAAPCWAGGVRNPQNPYNSAIIPGWDMWNTPAAPPALKYLLANYGAAPGREMTASGTGLVGCRCWLFNGGIAISADEKTGEVTDFSRQIATLAHKDKPVKVYRIMTLVDKPAPATGDRPAQPPDPAAPVAKVTKNLDVASATGPAGVSTSQPQPAIVPLARLFIATDCGLWMMDPQGKLSRIELGNSSDLPVAIMDWPQKEDRIYVGITPQFLSAPDGGGQAFELDPLTGKATLTGGLCTQSADNAYFVLNDPANPRRMDYALTAIYTSSHKAPATSQKAKSE